jgi:hypothetical protein
VIYLNPEVASSLGEDTFWTWFKREFPSSRFGLPGRLNESDIVLQYSTLGFANRSGKSLALLWELLPQMKDVFESSEWDDRLNLIYECARFSTWRTTPTDLTRPAYENYGSVEVLPIGVDTDLFRPIPEKGKLREKFGIPLKRRVGMWVGTTHPMKGYREMVEVALGNPDTHWIVVWKQSTEAGHHPGGSNFIQVSQDALCELFNCADFYLSSSQLPSFYMAEWEAMACDLPVLLADDHLVKDFVPSSNPRDDVFKMGWDRKAAKQLWSGFLERRGVEW